LAMPYKIYAPASVHVNSDGIDKVYIFGGKDESDILKNTTLEYSENILGVNDIDTKDSKFIATYNAASNAITIQRNETSDAKLSLYNSNGVLVRQENLSGNQSSLYTGSLSAGVYILRIVQKDNSCVQKLLLY